MPLSGLLSVAARLVTPIAETLTSLVQSSPGRRVWVSDDRLHVEVRGVHRPGTEDAAEALRQRLLGVGGVRGVEINGHFGRVVITHDPERTSRRMVLDVVAEIEHERARIDERGKGAVFARYGSAVTGHSQVPTITTLHSLLPPKQRT